MPGHDPPARDLRAAHLDDVLVRLHAELVVDAHRRDHEAEVGCDLAADHAHAAQQRAAGCATTAAVDERHEPEADGELERVDADLGHRLLAGFRQRRLRGGGADGGVGVGCAGHAVAHGPCDRAEDRGDQQERQLWQAGDQREQADRAGGHERRLALAEDLVGDVRAEVAVGGGAGDDDAGGDRDQQRGDLRGEAVTDGQQRVLVGGFG